MSHFTVLVKIKEEKMKEHGKEALAVALAPYQENNMGTCPEQYMEFEDNEDELRKEYAEGKDEQVVMPDGTYKWGHDEAFRVPKTIGVGRDTHKVPDHLEIKEVPLSEIYPTFEDFARDYHGYDGPDSKTGRYGYWENPNAKWDWYQIGGRWTGILRVKEMAASARWGVPSLPRTLLDPEYQPPPPHTADVCTVEDLDGMIAEARVKAREFLKKVKRARELGVFTLEDLRMRYETLGGNDADREEAGRVSHTVHSVLWDLGLRYRKSRDEPFIDEPFTEKKILAEYLWYWKPSTHAVLDEQGWHEKGSMGWFGCSSDDADDRKKWCSEYVDRFLKNEDPKTTLVVVDCHI